MKFQYEMFCFWDSNERLVWLSFSTSLFFICIFECIVRTFHTEYVWCNQGEGVGNWSCAFEI